MSTDRQAYSEPLLLAGHVYRECYLFRNERGTADGRGGRYEYHSCKAGGSTISHFGVVHLHRLRAPTLADTQGRRQSQRRLMFVIQHITSDEDVLLSAR
jgi:hypothetical protein